MNFPTKTAGRFTVWGIGGTSFIEFEPSGALDSTNLFSGANEQSNFTSNTAVVGASHKYFFNKNTFYELILASSVSNTLGTIDTLSEGGDAFNTVGFNRLQMKNSVNIKLNHKINAKNTIAAGFIGDNFITKIVDSAYVAGDYRTIADNTGSTKFR